MDAKKSVLKSIKMASCTLIREFLAERFENYTSPNFVLITSGTMGGALCIVSSPAINLHHELAGGCARSHQCHG